VHRGAARRVIFFPYGYANRDSCQVGGSSCSGEQISNIGGQIDFVIHLQLLAEALCMDLLPKEFWDGKMPSSKQIDSILDDVSLLTLLSGDAAGFLPGLSCLRNLSTGLSVLLDVYRKHLNSCVPKAQQKYDDSMCRFLFTRPSDSDLAKGRSQTIAKGEGTKGKGKGELPVPTVDWSGLGMVLSNFAQLHEFKTFGGGRKEDGMNSVSEKTKMDHYRKFTVLPDSKQASKRYLQCVVALQRFVVEGKSPTFMWCDPLAPLACDLATIAESDAGPGELPTPSPPVPPFAAALVVRPTTSLSRARLPGPMADPQRWSKFLSGIPSSCSGLNPKNVVMDSQFFPANSFRSAVPLVAFEGLVAVEEKFHENFRMNGEMRDEI
jgi:hypothetical protein